MRMTCHSDLSGAFSHTSAGLLSILGGLLLLAYIFRNSLRQFWIQYSRKAEVPTSTSSFYTQIDHVDPQAASSDEEKQDANPETKKCPLCAEDVKFEARICRVCRHNFEVLTTQVKKDNLGQKIRNSQRIRPLIIGITVVSGLVAMALLTKSSNSNSNSETSNDQSNSNSGSSTSTSQTNIPKPTDVNNPLVEPLDVTSLGNCPIGPSTFTGKTAKTPYGPVQVRVIVKAGKIRCASAVKYPNSDYRSRSINSQAFPYLIEETLAANSSNIQGVGGASYTSQGWYESLVSALTNTGIK